MEGENIKNQAPIGVDVLDASRNPVGRIDLAAEVFDAPVKVHLLHEAVVYQQAKHRAGTAKAKARGEVAGSNRKPWRQKGTGRARSGERTSPVWRGGGAAFGPIPRDMSIGMTKKARKNALRSALTAKRLDNDLLVVEEPKFEGPKTKNLLDWLGKLEAGENALVVIADADKAVELSARNLPRVKVIRAEGINVRDVLLYKKLVLTQAAARKVQEALV